MIICVECPVCKRIFPYPEEEEEVRIVKKKNEHYLVCSDLCFKRLTENDQEKEK